MAFPLSGLTGSIKVDGTEKTADKWDADLDQAVVDRANFTTLGEPLNAAGQRTGQITMEGPYEGTLGVIRGQLYTFRLVMDNGVEITTQARVSKVKFTNDAKDGPKWVVNAAQYGAATVNHL